MNPSLRERLALDSFDIPTLPSVVAKINAMVDDPEVGTRELGRVVAEDAPISAKVLKIANSAYYGLRERVLSTEHATAILGVRALRNIAMRAGVIAQFAHIKSTPDFDVNELWRHSILTGQVCAELARSAQGRLNLAPEEFYVVGLLHDVGKVVLLDNLGAEYVAIIREAARSGVPMYVCEKQTLGMDHTEVGEFIALRWNLPAVVCRAIRYHHGPLEEVVKSPIVALVANVNIMVQRVAAGDAQGALNVFDRETCSKLGVRHDECQRLVAKAFAFLPQIAL
jgi:HD-like signal output (HDOD) protein